jgi:hypothetical protein
MLGFPACTTPYTHTKNFVIVEVILVVGRMRRRITTAY